MKLSSFTKDYVSILLDKIESKFTDKLKRKETKDNKIKNLDSKNRKDGTARKRIGLK